MHNQKTVPRGGYIAPWLRDMFELSMTRQRHNIALDWVPESCAGGAMRARWTRRFPR